MTREQYDKALAHFENFEEYENVRNLLIGYQERSMRMTLEVNRKKASMIITGEVIKYLISFLDRKCSNELNSITALFGEDPTLVKEKINKAEVMISQLYEYECNLEKFNTILEEAKPNYVARADMTLYNHYLAIPVDIEGIKSLRDTVKDLHNRLSKQLEEL